MIVCLSSGHTPLYRDGVLETLYTLNGVARRFRYAIAKSVSQSVRTRQEQGTLENQEVLICYVDQSDPHKPLEFVPCRIAVIGTTDTVGGQLHLALRHIAFAYAPNLTTFCTQLQQSAVFDSTSLDDREALPSWKDPRPNPLEPLGAHCFEIAAQPPELCRESSPNNWHLIVGQLSAHQNDFAGITRFYRCDGVYDGATRVQLDSGRFALRPGKRYHARMVYLTPVAQSPVEELTVLASERISPVGTNRFEVSGTQDFVDVPFRTTIAPKTDDSELAVASLRRTTSGVSQRNEFTVPLTVTGQWLTHVVLSMVLAGAVALQGIAGVLSKDNPRAAIVLIVTGTLFAGLATFWKSRSGDGN